MANNEKLRMKLILLSFGMAVVISCATGCASTKTKNSYQIGETGPGKGIIFFAENGTYMECSLGLGRDDWKNTQKIINKYRGGWKKDWRLPTTDELELIYKNLKSQDLGGFAMDKYWSSLEENNDYVWVFDFISGAKDTHKKIYSGSIRAVRSFELQ